MAGKIKVPSELVPSQSNKIILRSKYVYDDVKGHTQEEVNAALEEQIENKVIEAGGVNWDTVPTAGSDNAVKSKDIKAALEKVTGYFVLDSNVTESTVDKTVTVADFPALSIGGSIKIKMLTKNTATNPTLKIGPANAIAYPLYYNEEKASADNSWEENEVISVYFDGINYMASNAQGGGGKAEKIKYDNSQSGLAAENVQRALDEVSDELTNGLYNHTNLDVSYGGDYSWILGTIHDDNGKAYNSASYYHINIPVEAGMRMKITANQNTYTHYTFLKDINFSYAESNGTDISSHYCDGYSNVIRVEAGESAAFTIPEDCNYLYILCGQTSGDVRAPESVVALQPRLDIAQEFGNSAEKVVSQKVITKEFEVLGDNLIDMSTMGADTTGTTYLTATKDVENNGVVFNVVVHTNSSPFGRMYPINLVAGKTYRLSFEYLNTAYQTAPAFRNSSNTYISSDISSVQMPVNTEYKTWECTFVAPDNVYYLAFANLANGAAGKSLTIRNFSLVEVGSLKGKVSEIDDEVEQLQDDIDNIDNMGSASVDISVVSDGKAVRASDGTLVTVSNTSHSDYLPTYGASKISVYAPPLGSSIYGIAFYGRTSTASFITPADSSVYIFSHIDGWKWITYDVPEGATKFRMSLVYNTPSQYRIVTPLNYLQDIFLRGVEDMIATQIFRQAIMVSDKQYVYAFAVNQMSIVNGKAYINYSGNENSVDGDTINNNNVACMSVVDLCDMSYTYFNPTTGTIQYYDGTTVEPVSSFGIRIGYITQCPTPDNKIAYFGLMRRNNNNPYYCWSIQSPSDTVNNWKTCRLSYNGNTVDFTANNYRQMLVDMGYTPSYIASTSDAIDNINLHYDKTEGIYYAVLCMSNSAFPLVLMQSTDLATWTPKANLGTSYAGNEIAAIYKDGIAYVIWRIASNSSRNYIQWRIYDVANDTVLSQGQIPGTKEIASKPDCFIFNNEVYMAANVNPSIYGEIKNNNNYAFDARSEIVIYKIIDNTPVYFRRVCNPTGIDYFAFMQSNSVYADSQANPIVAQNSIYVAFGEDRRHLYRRQIAQISFADVTALFADFGRIY